jgi:L-threonylcarbamoyladenylate synthase
MPILDGSQDSNIQSAALALAQGRLVAIPTETVYGLAARSDNDDAVGAIFQAKGRPADHPLIVHVASQDDATEWITELPTWAIDLATAVWPGPLQIQDSDFRYSNDDRCGIRSLCWLSVHWFYRRNYG